MADQTTSQTPVATPVVATQEDIEKNKGIAAVSYIIFFLPLVVDSAKNSKFALFHANQALLLLIAGVAGSIILGFIPILGWIVLAFWPLIWLIFIIIGAVNANNGKMQPLPIIGNFNLHILDK